MSYELLDLLRWVEMCLLGDGGRPGPELLAIEIDRGNDTWVEVDELELEELELEELDEVEGAGAGGAR